jgi:hypothetical protein
MYSTTAYLYQQKTRVLMIDTGGDYFIARYNPVYAKKLTINKGVDNVLLFEFINQDEKPVNITGSTMTFRVVDQSGEELVNETEMVILSAPYGRAKVTLPSGVLDNIRAQPASYSITRYSGNLTEAVFVDAQAGARADVDIVDSVYPEFYPSAQTTIPTVDLSAMSGSTASGSPATYPDWALNPGTVINTWSPLLNTEFYSSFIVPTSSVTSIQMDLVGYTGTVKIQGAENYQSVWYNVSESTQYLNRTGTVHHHVIGYHPILRLCFNNSVYATGLNGQVGIPAMATAIVSDEGVITGATITYPGQGYLAPPLIEFVGDGAGATATAEISYETGQLSSITIIDGGSGYRPIPPTNTQAQVVISTGRVENILYR